MATTRQIGMGIGPIPFTAVVDYFTIYNIDGDFQEFASIIRRMDDLYLALEAEELKSKNSGEKSKGASTNRNKKNNN